MAFKLPNRSYSCPLAEAEAQTLAAAEQTPKAKAAMAAQTIAATTLMEPFTA